MGSRIYQQENKHNPFLSNLELNEYQGMRRMLIVTIDGKSTGSLPANILEDYCTKGIARLQQLRFYLEETKKQKTTTTTPIQKV